MYRLSDGLEHLQPAVKKQRLCHLPRISGTTHARGQNVGFFLIFLGLTVLVVHYYYC